MTKRNSTDMLHSFSRFLISAVFLMGTKRSRIDDKTYNSTTIAHQFNDLQIWACRKYNHDLSHADKCTLSPSVPCV